MRTVAVLALLAVAYANVVEPEPPVATLPEEPHIVQTRNADPIEDKPEIEHPEEAKIEKRQAVIIQDNDIDNDDSEDELVVPVEPVPEVVQVSKRQAEPTEEQKEETQPEGADDETIVKRAVYDEEEEAYGGKLETENDAPIETEDKESYDEKEADAENKEDYRRKRQSEPTEEEKEETKPESTDDATIVKRESPYEEEEAYGGKLDTENDAPIETEDKESYDEKEADTEDKENYRSKRQSEPTEEKKEETKPVEEETHIVVKRDTEPTVEEPKPETEEVERPKRQSGSDPEAELKPLEQPEKTEEHREKRQTKDDPKAEIKPVDEPMVDDPHHVVRRQVEHHEGTVDVEPEEPATENTEERPKRESEPEPKEEVKPVEEEEHLEENREKRELNEETGEGQDDEEMVEETDDNAENTDDETLREKRHTDDSDDDDEDVIDVSAVQNPMPQGPIIIEAIPDQRLQKRETVDDKEHTDDEHEKIDEEKPREPRQVDVSSSEEIFVFPIPEQPLPEEQPILVPIDQRVQKREIIEPTEEKQPETTVEEVQPREKRQVEVVPSDEVVEVVQPPQQPVPELEFEVIDDSPEMLENRQKRAAPAGAAVNVTRRRRYIDEHDHHDHHDHEHEHAYPDCSCLHKYPRLPLFTKLHAHCSYPGKPHRPHPPCNTCGHSHPPKKPCHGHGGHGHGSVVHHHHVHVVPHAAPVHHVHHDVHHHFVPKKPHYRAPCDRHHSYSHDEDHY